MSLHPHFHRNPVEQMQLNSHMRRPEVQQFLLHQALHSEPATPEQVRAFLKTAPPEIFILLDALLPLPARKNLRDESVHDSPILQGLVGFFRTQQREEP